MRRVPIRLKLAAALSIPLLALTVVTAIEVLHAADEVDAVREQTELAAAAVGPTGLITALQNERTWPAVDLIGQGDMVNVPVADYAQSRAETDAALAAFRTEIESKDESIANAFRPALDQLDQLDQIRADIDANVAAVNPRTTENNLEFAHGIFDRYTALIEPFFDSVTRISLVIDDPELRQGTELADTVARQIEVLSLLLHHVIGDATLSENGIDTPEEITRAATLLTRFRNNAELMEQASGPYADIAAELFPAQMTADVVEQAQAAITSSGTFDLAAILAVVNVPEDEGYLGYQRALDAEIKARSASLNDGASARQRLYVLLAALVLGVAIALTWLVSRSITKPLRSLTHQAKEMAERRLPDAVLDILQTPLGQDVVMPSIQPVRIDTRDEVADVSAALDTVQDTALDLAVEQAVLRRNIADSFVNLGRRNQNLLGRQLDFITELESNESDPDTLANLFRLDHLATRMRRNAESLLVLAGVEPPRKWAAPVRLTDVIRAALGEVEDYQRVTVRGVEPATILGSVAADLAHLMAELIENALVFSPPDQTVDIRGRNRPPGPDSHDGGYTLAIIDSGLGMPPADIAAANRRLAGAESFTIAPSKYLGHYVAGNLAARHDIRVNLANSPGNGITATIDLPPTLLTTEAPAPALDESHAARDVWPPTPVNGPRTGELPAARDLAPPSGAGDDRPGVLPPLPARGEGPSPVPAYGAGSFGPTADPGPPPDAPAWLSGPPADPAAGPPLDDRPRRTPSGLVKRTPRVVDTGELRALGASPDDDLLATLSRYTGGRDRTGQTPAIDPTAAHHAPTPYPADPPAAPAPTPPRGPAGPPAAPRGDQPSRGASGGAGFGGLAAGLGGVSPFEGRKPNRTTAPPPHPAAPGNGGATPGGLTRRVRGAQMPTTEPLSLRRRAAADGPAQPPAPTPDRQAPPAPAGTTATERDLEQRSADAVYGFLSAFSSGVQRGLDDARSRPPHR